MENRREPFLQIQWTARSSAEIFSLNLSLVDGRTDAISPPCLLSTLGEEYPLSVHCIASLTTKVWRLPNMSFLTFFLLLLLAVIEVAAQVASLTPEATVSISLGKLRGNRLVTENGNEGLVFLGVPYGEPPVGQNRFRPSTLVAKPWEGTRDATNYALDCYSLGYTGGLNMSEDCLYLNV